MESLGKIFGSIGRIKIMRMFLFNSAQSFDIDTVVSRTRLKRVDARKELTMLTKIGFLRKKDFIKKTTKEKKGEKKPVIVKKKVSGWALNRRFELIEPLQQLLIDRDLINEKLLVSKIRKAGSIKLLLLSGIFTRDDNRKLDILVVGNRLKKDILEEYMLVLESEIGRELRYAFFSEQEYEYRLSMYDKLIRDSLENEHISLINSL